MGLYDAKEPIEITVIVKRGGRTATFTGLRALGITIEEKHDDDGFRSFFDAPSAGRIRTSPPTRLAIIAETPLIDEQTGALYTTTVNPPLAQGEEF